METWEPTLSTGPLLGIAVAAVAVILVLVIYFKLQGPNPGKWTRGFNQDAIVSVADPAASKAFGER